VRGRPARGRRPRPSSRAGSRGADLFPGGGAHRHRAGYRPDRRRRDRADGHDPAARSRRHLVRRGCDQGVGRVSLSKVLIANRGEIAVRVMRACRELGVATVAVFSDVDRDALHVQMADEAYPIGAAPTAESYLNIEKIVGVAKSAGADAIHPGYGFLAEDAAFAEACAAAGLIFLGPPPPAIRAMGDKIAARRLARELGVPTIPGTLEPISGDDAARAAAREVGYPVMIKAAMGGGGKGMRLVRREEELMAALR